MSHPSEIVEMTFLYLNHDVQLLLVCELKPTPYLTPPPMLCEEKCHTKDNKT